MVTTNYHGTKIKAKTVKGVMKIIKSLQDVELREKYSRETWEKAIMLKPLEIARIMVALDSMAGDENRNLLERKEAVVLYNKLDRVVKEDLRK